MTGFSKTMQFLSTPSARRATPEARPRHPARWISIHALREEGDLVQRSGNPNRIDFYPRPPRGGRPQIAFFKAAGSLFLSTPSARRATRFLLCLPLVKLYFYPRPPRGGRLPSRCHSQRPFCISIHALREEGDTCRDQYDELQRLFLSTPSARRATSTSRRAAQPQPISIHALREEGDHFRRGHRERSAISIHALREEGDQTEIYTSRRLTNFYPRPPRGGRPIIYQRHQRYILFLSTPSARRATAKTETKSLFSNKLYNILHEFRRALIYNGSKSYPNHAK